ncbi:MAG: bifunctional anthranilate synthase component II/anthranilate phosphoribosyltransferase, partial [Lentisphaeria bacterium]
MILLIDNYDSFTYNLYQVFLKFNYPIKVVRSDKITIEEIIDLNPSHIVLSPGPKTPYEAGICMEVVDKLKGKYPILGICLGHQAILASFGVPIVNASRIVHGKVERIFHNGCGLFRNVKAETKVTRYHSLAGKEKDIPDCFVVSARSADGEVMAVEHKEFQLAGMQYHPESIGSEDGEKMLLNFLHYRRDNIDIKSYLKKVVNREDLSYQQAYDLMDELTEGNMQEAQIGSILTSLAMKEVKAEELAGFAAVLRKKAELFPKPKIGEKRIDTCGTGGGNCKNFNVSTLSSFIVAAAGANVVKHGNRGVTSKVGSADLLEMLGVNIDMPIDKSIELYENLGMTFLYARKFHSAMRFMASARSALGFRSTFNLIGPLVNPASASHQVIGVFSPEYTQVMCEALKLLGVERAMVVSGLDGYDEISLTGPSQISELQDGVITTYTFDPNDIGVTCSDSQLLKSDSIAENKQIAYDLLIANEQGPRNDLLCLNAGASLYTYGLANSL